ncbi:MAG: response regulator [Bacteroidales bacterium]|nr:response regulator [Bacteroidales bacterium]
MKKKIVVVDDFENTRWIIEFALRGIECEVLKAENGKEALKFFDGRSVDLLITDYNMPVMDGAQLISEVRNMESYQFMPVIMLTTETSEKKKEKAKESKVTAWIQKPFKQEEFMAIIKRCLRIK